MFTCLSKKVCASVSLTALSLSFFIAPLTALAVSQADLAITTMHEPASSPSAPLLLTVTVQNNGPDPATLVVVRGMIPDGYAFDGGATSGCVGSSFGQDFTCFSSSQPLLSGSTKVYTVYANPTSPLLCGSVVMMPSTHVEPSPSEMDADLSNNTTLVSSFTIACEEVEEVAEVATADLSLTAVIPTTVEPAAPLVIPYTVYNAGPLAATMSVVRGMIPDGYAFDGAATSGCVGSSFGQDFTCFSSATPLAAGSDRTFTVYANPVSALPCSTVVSVPSAYVESSASEPDLVMANNATPIGSFTVACAEPASSSSSSSSSSESSSSSSAPSEPQTPAPTPPSSSSSSAPIIVINPNFNPPAPGTSQNSGSSRGHETNVLSAIIRFITRDMSSIPPPAFGGARMALADISSDQKNAICGMAKTMKYNSSYRLPAQEMVAMTLALQLGLPRVLVLNALQDTQFCGQ
ncbi:MAG: hypothetical protein KBD00_02150 [Candidatus Peribacteraceae bacterium]|nr:hypothetical protein [Candidatus Peribacteraceae bacterium]